MLSESFLRAKKSNFKEEELCKMRMRVLEREEDTRRKFHIFHIEKARTAKWKSLEQIKSSIQKDNQKRIPDANVWGGVGSGMRGGGDKRNVELQSRISSISTDDLFAPREKKPEPKRVEVKDWAEYSYEQYLVMLEELELTLKIVPKEPVKEEIEANPDFPDFNIPEIVIQPYTDSDSEVSTEITGNKMKAKKLKKRNNKPKTIDFGRIKYLKNLKQVKSINFTNK